MLISRISSYYYLQPNCICFLNLCDFLALPISHALSLPYIFFFISLSLSFSLSLFYCLSFFISLTLTDFPLYFQSFERFGQKSFSFFGCLHTPLVLLFEWTSFCQLFSTFFGAKKTFQFLLSLVCSQTKNDKNENNEKDEKTNREIKTTIDLYVISCATFLRKSFVSKIFIKNVKLLKWFRTKFFKTVN